MILMVDLVACRFSSRWSGVSFIPVHAERHPEEAINDSLTIISSMRNGTWLECG